VEEFQPGQAGGRWVAARANIYSLIGTCLLNKIDPSAYLRHVLCEIAEHSINRIEALLPWRIAPNLLAPQ
jgi:transposase